MDAVVSVGIRSGASISWIGTGFFIIKPVGNEEFLPFMLTNRHVLEGNKAVVIRLKEKNTQQLRIIDMPLEENGSPIYSVHDNDKVV